MNIKKHFCRRYCERILNLTDEQEINTYIAQNMERLTEHCLSMFKHATFIYRGQIGDNITRNYYLRDNIILITDSQNTALITLYRIDYGFPDETNRKITQDLLQIIMELHGRLEMEEAMIIEQLEAKQTEIDTLSIQIKALEEQLAILKHKRKVAEEEKIALRSSTEFTRKELEKYAVLLCNSLEYRKELQVLSKQS